MESAIACRRPGGALILAFTLFAQAAWPGVGRTPGLPSVTADGEAAYSIPLTLPPGTAGMTPSLSLEYRHRAPAGLLGIGWSVGGLSQIARCPRTIAQDGVSAPVVAAPNDRFCLDGRRLMVVNGATYGSPGAEYRTEIETFARIRSYTGVGAGPQYFIVESADGRLFEYGATPDSRQDGGVNTTNIARIWALNRIRDRSGNVIDFQYVEDPANADFYISDIRYNSNPGAGVAPAHVVSFAYENRPNSEIDVGYVAGSLVRRIKRLIRIDITHQDAIVRRYELGYEPALSPSGRSRLASLRECGAGGMDCLAPTNFTWLNGTAGLGAESSITAASPSAGGFPAWATFLASDINGDGRADMLWAGGASLGSSTIRYRLALAAGGFGAEVDTGIASPIGLGVPFDHNGDGRMDLVGTDASRRWIIVPGTSAGLGAPIATGLAVPSGLYDFRGADLNGDGLGDLVYSEIWAPTGNSLVVRVHYALTTGGFAAEPVTLYEQVTAIGYNTPEGGRFIGRPGERIDFDHDGAEDLLLDETYTVARISRTGWTTEFFDGSAWGVFPVDLNGDGCTDIVYPHYTGRVRARFTGCSLFSIGADLQGPTLSGTWQFAALDWNADGRADVLLKGASNWFVVPFIGDAFGALMDTGIAHNGASNPVVVDFDGNGLDDLVTRVAGQARTRPHAGARGDLLATAMDGFSVAAIFTYRPLTDPAVYTRGDGAAYPDQDVQSAAYVVSALTTSDGGGGGAFAETQYRYEQLRRNLFGRGSLGFARRIVTDPAFPRQLSVEESRHQAFPLTGLPVRVTARRLSGALLADTRYDWTPLELGDRRYPYAASVTHAQYALDGSNAGAQILSTTQTVGAIDPVSGIATDATLTTTEIATGMNAGASATRRVTHSSVLNDVTNWCLGRPLATQVAASHTQAGGSAIARNYSQAWNGLKCRPTQQRVEPGTQWRATRVFGYDAFGNVASSELTGYGMPARATTISWDGAGRFPLTVRNALAQATTYAWDPATGNLLSATDPNALTVGWTYDAQGDLTSETRPDGTSTLLTRLPCTGCVSGVRAKVSVQERDDQGLVQASATFELDQHGRASRITATAAGGGQVMSSLTFDARGRPAREFLPYWFGGTPAAYWDYEYDALDRPLAARLRTVTGALERTVTLRHDGLTVARTDSRGLTTTFTANAWGDIVNVSDPAGGNTSYEYDALGRPLRVRDATAGTVASASYNARGMLLGFTDTDLGGWTFTPNALGELIAVRDPKGQQVSFSYDLLGRLTSRAAPEGTGIWTWGTSASAHDIGELAGVSAAGYSESYAYDAFGRPAVHTINADTSYRYDYTYNSLGLLDTLTYPGTLSGPRLRTRHEYDAGELVRISDADAPATSYWRLNAQDAAGNVIDETLGAGIRAISGYSPVTGVPEYRQTGAGGGSAIQNLAWNWDAGGNLTRRQDLNRNLVEEFRYDSLHRLDDSRRNGVTNLDLSYDGIGNISWKSDVCPTTSACFSYDPNRRHAVTAAGATSYTYDAAGNMASRGGAAITWDSAGQPISISHTSGNSSRFWHGPDGNRWKQVSNASGTSETTIYAGGLMEKVSRGRLMTWRHYVLAPTGTVAVQLRYSGGAATKTRYLTHDHLGSTDQILDSAGNVLAAASYGAFGARRGANWNGTPTALELAAINNVTDDGFTGHEHLDHLGLIHMEGRIYDPQIGRFLSADPLIPAPYDGQSLNRYAYVWNNPLSITDPSGYTPCVITESGNCARVTVIGLRDATFYLIGGAGAGQVASAKLRDPCGMESDGYTCQSLPTVGLIAPDFVLSVGTQVDPDLSRSPTESFLIGAAAQFANAMISAAPVSLLFGADPSFEWFDVPDSRAGRIGGYVGTGAAVYFNYRAVGRTQFGASSEIPASQFARSLQGSARYPGIDRFRDIRLKQGTILYGALPRKNSPFYTTASAIRRSGTSSAFLHKGLQMHVSTNFGPRTTYGAYLVTDDVAAAFGRALRNPDYGPGGLPQVVVPSHTQSLRLLFEIPLGP